MNKTILAGALLAASLGLANLPQSTPRPMAQTYGTLADAILALKHTEANFVRSMLDGHFHAAKAYAQRGEAERAAAEMALFSNEGDNAIGGVRKRLLEGGHHHHADGESDGTYEPGYVVVTRKAKEAGLALSAQMRQARSDADRSAVWARFEALAAPLLEAH